LSEAEAQLAEALKTAAVVAHDRAQETRARRDAERAAEVLATSMEPRARAWMSARMSPGEPLLRAVYISSGGCASRLMPPSLCTGGAGQGA